MSNTRLRILSVSKRMFNEKGFSNVTIRMIASELNMSSGNLNYHFKKREDILEALYFEMVDVFDARIKQLDTKEFTLEIVKEDVLLSLTRMIAYRFFWTDLYNLLKLNNTIKIHFDNAYKERYKGYGFLFKVLTEKGILNPFKFNKECDFLIQRMIGFSNTWLYDSCIYDIEINEGYIEQQTGSLLGMLYPYFTDLGKSDYNKLFPSFFK